MATLVRFSTSSGTRCGELEGGIIHDLAGSLFEAPRRTGRTRSLQDITLLAPVTPSKVIAVGLNYRSHLHGREISSEPGIFLKPSSCISSPNADIVLPADASNVHYEGEMVVVIGKDARHVEVEHAAEHILGVTAGNDVSERDWQAGDLQWFRAKGCDTFGPIGPAIATDVDYNNLLLETRINGETRQSQRTADLIFPVEEVVSFLSRYVTLFPGDVVFTGTPGSTQALHPGDVVEVELEGVGVLRNSVRAGP